MVRSVWTGPLRRPCEGIAERLTAWENHRTEGDHEDSLVFKRFFFEAFDSYIVLFYVGFFMRDPLRLRLELVSLYTADSVRRMLLETVIPWFMQRASVARDDRLMRQSKKIDESREGVGEAAAALAKAPYEQFDDYLEMVVDFGYVMLFAGAMPLASAITVLSNIIEVHSDAFKLVHVCRRPTGHRVSSMPRCWFRILVGIAWASILTNVFFTFACSEQVAQWMPELFKVKTGSHSVRKDGIWTMVVVEHVVVMLAMLLRSMLPSKARWVSDAVKGRAYRERRALMKVESLRFQQSTHSNSNDQ